MSRIERTVKVVHLVSIAVEDDGSIFVNDRKLEDARATILTAPLNSKCGVMVESTGAWINRLDHAIVRAAIEHPELWKFEPSAADLGLPKRWRDNAEGKIADDKNPFGEEEKKT